MTNTDTCVRCGRPTADGYADNGCANRATTNLAAIIDLAPDARLVAAGLVRRGGGSSGGKPASRPPLNDAATDALGEVQNTLTTLARDIAETRGLHQPRALGQDPVVVAARWLGQQVEWLRHAVDGTEPYAVRAYDEIEACAGRLRGMVNGPAEQRYLGPCGAPTRVDVTTFDQLPGSQLVDAAPCEGDVYARGGAKHGTCRTCGATVATDERRAWLDGEVRGHAFRASQIAGAYGVNVNTIRSWHARGQLVAHGHDPDGRPLFNVGDVLDLAAADAARRAGEQAKRARRAAAREAAESEGDHHAA